MTCGRSPPVIYFRQFHAYDSACRRACSRIVLGLRKPRPARADAGPTVHGGAVARVPVSLPAATRLPGPRIAIRRSSSTPGPRDHYVGSVPEVPAVLPPTRFADAAISTGLFVSSHGIRRQGRWSGRARTDSVLPERPESLSSWTLSSAAVRQPVDLGRFLALVEIARPSSCDALTPSRRRRRFQRVRVARRHRVAGHRRRQSHGRLGSDRRGRYGSLPRRPVVRRLIQGPLR